MMLASVFGGLIIGLGVGLVIRSGGSTGGSDVISLVLNKHFGFPTAPALYVVDCIILCLQAVFASSEEILFGLLVVMLYSVVIDKVILFGGSDVPVSYTHLGKYAITVVSLGKAFNFTGVNHADVIISDEELRQRYMRQRNADHFGSIGPFEYASVLGAYCEEGKQWFEEVRDYIQENAHMVKSYIEKELPKARVFPIEGTSVCWIDWSFLGLEGDALESFFLKEALFAVEAGHVYGPGCGAFTRMNLSSPRSQIEAALHRVKEAVVRYEKDR